MTSTRAFFFLATLLALVSRWSAVAEAAPPRSPHAEVASLVSEGFPVGDGERTHLKPSVVHYQMSGDEQQKALTRLVGRSRMRQFLRDSPVARFELDVNTIGETSGGDSIRGLDLYFVAYGSLDTIRDRNLMDKFSSAEQEGKQQPFETYVEPIEGRPDPNQVDPVEWAEQSRIYRYRLPVLEKVVVSGLLRGQAYVDDGLLIQSIQTPEDRRNDRSDPTQWRAIPRGADGDADLGPQKPFFGMAGYLQATELKFQQGAVLVEFHGVYVEPHGWFSGKNLLASKLPIAMQDSVRKFRRKLSEIEADSR